MEPVDYAVLRVRYAETDQMGVVYYANYLIWMEVGRVEFCRAQGIRYRDMEDRRRHPAGGGRGQLPLPGPRALRRRSAHRQPPWPPPLRA